jgi:CO/xanthine dehydrogenase Mo-binding subunit
VLFAAHMLEAGEEEMDVLDEHVFVRADPGRTKSFGDIARAAHSFRLSFPKDDQYQSGLVAQYTYDHPLTTLPNADRSDLGIFYPIVGHACHIAVIEVDDDTHQVRFLRYVAVHDAGTVLNPKLVDGQIRGGIAQGIGTALYEKYVYDENGQLLTGSLADYAMPTAAEVPDIIVGHVETPSPYTEFGMKGCGEGGRLASMPAIAAAIDNAFADEQLYVDELPVTPSFLHELRTRRKPSGETQ